MYGDVGNPWFAVRGHVFNAPGAGNGYLQGGGNKALHGSGTGTGVHCFHVNYTAFQLGELAYRQAVCGLPAQ